MLVKEKSIFVQIASYRDPELLPTINDCIAKAKFPENLTFGICWQKDVADACLQQYMMDNRFTIWAVPYNKSKGTCWARHMTNLMLKNEAFTLQIDSHTRFIPNWDEELLMMWNNLKDAKAVLTAYPPQYEPHLHEKEWKTDSQICLVHNFKDGLTEQRPASYPKNGNKTSFKAVHVAAGFIFAPANIILDVPYDPELYFTGEETALTVRLFTHGYNLYHPNKACVYHYYGRKDQPKHWVDDTNWMQLHVTARQRLECLLQRNNNKELGAYQLGSSRTLQEFTEYSGIDYHRNIIHLDTVLGKEPPVDNTDQHKWSYEKKIFDQVVCWKDIKIDKCEDLKFWALFVKDQNDKEIFREDLRYSEYKHILNGTNTQKRIKFEYFFPFQMPTHFMIWPYSESQHWLVYARWKL